MKSISGRRILVTFGGSNAGDVFSDPSLYFRLGSRHTYSRRLRLYRKRWNRLNRMFDRGHLPSNCVIILGGGGVLDASVSRSQLMEKLLAANTVILWGVGTNRPNQAAVSRTLNDDESKVQAYDLERAALVGLRDFHQEPRGAPKSGISYVPCASCMMGGLDRETSTKRSVGIIEHEWLNETAPYELEASIPRISMSLKRFSIEYILQFIAESDAIYTESYHAAYWSLLMGKKVIVQGPTSSKFLTLQYPVTFATTSMEKDIERANAAPFPSFIEDARSRNQLFHSQVADLINSKSV